MALKQLIRSIPGPVRIVPKPTVTISSMAAVTASSFSRPPSPYTIDSRRSRPVQDGRRFSTSPLRWSDPGLSTPLPRGSDSPEVKSLVAAGWRLDETGQGISKTFYFKTFTKCQDFFNLIAIRSKSAKHHSTTTIKFRSVHIHWTTHNPASLSTLDTAMAKYCEEQAKVVGNVDSSQITTC